MNTEHNPREANGKSEQDCPGQEETSIVPSSQDTLILWGVLVDVKPHGEHYPKTEHRVSTWIAKLRRALDGLNLFRNPEGSFLMVSQLCDVHDEEDSP